MFDSVTADTITANESVTVGTGANQTKIDGGTVTVDNQITVGGTNGTVINNGSVSIKNDSAYFRENAMKVGSMTYDGVSNTSTWAAQEGSPASRTAASTWEAATQ